MNQCARVAYDKGYEYFAVQFYGECHGGKDAGKSYAKYEKSDDCWMFNKQAGHGVGKDLTNFVYRIKQVGKKEIRIVIAAGFSTGLMERPLRKKQRTLTVFIFVFVFLASSAEYILKFPLHCFNFH